MMMILQSYMLLSLFLCIVSSSHLVHAALSSSHTSHSGEASIHPWSFGLQGYSSISDNLLLTSSNTGNASSSSHYSHHLEKRQSGSGRATYYGAGNVKKLAQIDKNLTAKSIDLLDPGDPAPSTSTPGACGPNHLPPNPSYFCAVVKTN